MSYLEKVTLPECEKGAWKVYRFTPKSIDFWSAMNGRHVPVGETFTGLTRDGTLVMSDTPAEQCDHYAAVCNAKGHCLVNGLGIGMVLKNMLRKPEVTAVTVVEVSQDLIDLIAPHYADPRVTMICADAYTYVPPKGFRYGCVWHDIWDTMSEDNLPLMAKLHRKYGRLTDWQGSWGKDWILRDRRKELRYQKANEWIVRRFSKEVEL